MDAAARVRLIAWWELFACGDMRRSRALTRSSHYDRLDHRSSLVDGPGQYSMCRAELTDKLPAGR